MISRPVSYTHRFFRHVLKTFQARGLVRILLQVAEPRGSQLTDVPVPVIRRLSGHPIQKAALFRPSPGTVAYTHLDVYKRQIIGEEFIRVFEEEAKKIGTVDFLVQGTIYPDVVATPTRSSTSPASTILRCPACWYRPCR